MFKVEVVRVSLTEFELADGRVFPIDPPLQEEMTPDEFQAHYDIAVAAVAGCRPARGNNGDPADLGQEWNGSGCS